ncbi:MAG TPA: RNA-binding S4 domain-containing protein [Caulobacteraceae bacterium]
MPEAEAARIDAWLWRARFFRSRSQASAKAAKGHIRLRRAGEESRIDKASRTIRVGDELTFVIGVRVIAVRVAALGERRGPPAEARGLYDPLEAAHGPPVAVDKMRGAPK